MNFLADLKGRASHDIVLRGSLRLPVQHRGALGAEKMLRWRWYPNRSNKFLNSHELNTPSGGYATGIAFVPQDESKCETAVKRVEEKRQR